MFLSGKNLISSINENYMSREPGGYSGFQVTGMIEGFSWVLNFRFRDFLGQEIFGKYFWGSLIYVGIFWGILNNLKIRDNSRVCRPLLEIFMARKFGVGYVWG